MECGKKDLKHGVSSRSLYTEYPNVMLKWSKRRTGKRLSVWGNGSLCGVSSTWKNGRDILCYLNSSPDGDLSLEFQGQELLRGCAFSDFCFMCEVKEKKWGTWLDGIIDSMGMSLSQLWEMVRAGKPGLCSPWSHNESDMTEWLNNDSSKAKVTWDPMRSGSLDSEPSRGPAEIGGFDLGCNQGQAW